MAFTYKPLWKLLIDKGMSKTEFREAVDISTATLANMGKDKYVSMEVLDRICSHFEVQISDVIEHGNSHN